MLTDHPDRKHIVKRRRRPQNAIAKTRWGDDQKIELIKLWLLTGNLAFSAASLSIPEDTARRWKATNWWKETEHELRLQKDFEINGHLGKIIDKSLEVIQDRLEGGDYIFDSKTGKLIRKPINAIQANKIVNDMLDRRDIIEAKAQSGVSQEVAIDKFVQLAEKFAALAQKTQEKPPIEVTDVIYVQEGETSAVHDQREAGLQEGEPPVQLEAETDQEPLEEDGSETEGEREWTYE